MFCHLPLDVLMPEFLRKEHYIVFAFFKFLISLKCILLEFLSYLRYGTKAVSDVKSAIWLLT